MIPTNIYLQDAGDLSIQQGDVIEILEETNADWWTGRVNGRQGIFPASYVEKIQAQAAAKEKPVYKPFRATYHGMDQPPAAGASSTNSVGLQEAPGKEEKKSKFGGLGNTVRQNYSCNPKLSLIQTVDGPFGCWWCWLRCRYVP